MSIFRKVPKNNLLEPDEDMHTYNLGTSVAEAGEVRV